MVKPHRSIRLIVYLLYQELIIVTLGYTDWTALSITSSVGCLCRYQES